MQIRLSNLKKKKSKKEGSLWDEVQLQVHYEHSRLASCSHTTAWGGAAVGEASLGGALLTHRDQKTLPGLVKAGHKEGNESLSPQNISVKRKFQGGSLEVVSEAPI